MKNYTKPSDKEETLLWVKATTGYFSNRINGDGFITRQGIANAPPKDDYICLIGDKRLAALFAAKRSLMLSLHLSFFKIVASFP